MTGKSPAEHVLLSADRMWDGRSDGNAAAGYVAVASGRIVAAGEGRAPAAYAAWPREQLPGLTLMPGAIDAHVHLFASGGPDPGTEPPESLPSATLWAAHRAYAMLAAGITSARDCGGREHADISLRDAIAAGTVPGPRLRVAGQLITMTGGQGHRLGREADGIDECRRAAREQIKAGADFIKLMATGGVTTPGVEPGAPQLELEELAAAVAEARKAGRLAAAHAQSAAGTRLAILAGVRSIEHGVDLPADVIDLMLERGTYLVPTLSAPYHILAASRAGLPIPKAVVAKTERVYEMHCDSVRRAAAAGVRLAMGTDAGTPYNLHGRNLAEIGLLVQAGVSVADAWRSATSGAAALLGIGDETGTIEAGKRADLIAVAGDPFVDITSIESRVCWVMQAGKVVRDDRGGGNG